MSYGLVTLAAVLAGAAGTSPVETLRNELARCAVVESAPERLACFDALSRRSIEHKFSGFGSGETAVFELKGPRILNFESSDVIMVVYLMTPDGDVVQNLHRGGSGVSSHPIKKAGKYRLQINASGAWKVWITAPKQG